MRQNAVRNLLNVLMREVVPTLEQGMTPRTFQETQACTRTAAQQDIGVFPARLDDRDDILEERLGPVNLGQFRL